MALVKLMLEKYKPALERTYSPEYQQSLPKDLAPASTPVAVADIKIGEWKSEEISSTGKELGFDASHAIKEEGEYEIKFTHQSGSRLEIDWVALGVNGSEIMRDTHQAGAGDPDKNNTFTVSPGAIVFNGTYTLRAKVKAPAGQDSNGIVTLRKKSH